MANLRTILGLDWKSLYWSIWMSCCWLTNTRICGKKKGDQYLMKYKDVLQAGLMPSSLISLCDLNIQLQPFGKEC
ncbi:hypothetical protein CMV_014409 [Castanea mollissima]|uniref:Uncharacterized protein n=1 Tax=Castanea mollissima TaxID=60419 RepID=A0A8J4QY05_9ROSI|nr:hypothetical protein CMV_014409 [Castanea mollissima]